MTVTIRQATRDDLPHVRDIYAFYVEKTVVSFLVNSPSLDYVSSRYEDSIERKLPYLVAVDGTSGSEVIVGYAYASAYRGFMLGYGHTVEISVFLEHNHIGKGIGSMLMKQLLLSLRKTKHVSRETAHQDKPQEFEIRNVLAVMSVDDQTPESGMELRNWYLHWGFEQVARLKEVGFKHGRR